MTDIEKEPKRARTSAATSLSGHEVNLTNVVVLNLSKSSHPINTGIGFFDHMLDQLNSHAQIGVSVTVTSSGCENQEDRNRHAGKDSDVLQERIMSKVGNALGEKLKGLLLTIDTENVARQDGVKSRFCCPLDEALVECVLELPSLDHSSSPTNTALCFDLAPYGIYPKTTGRTKIGHMMTAPLVSFFSNLASASGLCISLKKLRGKNGHHVVESAFKAFSRALRNLLDGTDTNVQCSPEDWSGNMAAMWGKESPSFQESLALNRYGMSSRDTKETSIQVSLYLDGGEKGIEVKTGIETLDLFYNHLAKESGMSLNVKCKGDTWVDDHHTSEDVSIAIGKVLNVALGTKAGLNRMWCAAAKYGDAIVEVTMDLSNRPCLTSNLSLEQSEYAGDVSVEMLDHALDSLVMNGQMTVHIVEKVSGAVMELAMSTAIAFGRALRLCCAVDPRRAGKTASSKGTLSA
jgi:imidazoleglycerol-phosphate dehydratase